VRFIELHNFDDQRLYINAASILTIAPGFSGGAVVTMDSGQIVVVKETIDEIMVKIRG
jgi:uncharacterized protein YlzI (FlbEa/FlbD family)